MQSSDRAFGEHEFLVSLEMLIAGQDAFHQLANGVLRYAGSADVPLGMLMAEDGKTKVPLMRSEVEMVRDESLAWKLGLERAREEYWRQAARGPVEGAPWTQQAAAPSKPKAPPPGQDLWGKRAARAGAPATPEAHAPLAPAAGDAPMGHAEAKTGVNPVTSLVGEAKALVGLTVSVPVLLTMCYKLRGLEVAPNVNGLYTMRQVFETEDLGGDSERYVGPGFVPDDAADDVTNWMWESPGEWRDFMQRRAMWTLKYYALMTRQKQAAVPVASAFVLAAIYYGFHVAFTWGLMLWFVEHQKMIQLGQDGGNAHAKYMKLYDTMRLGKSSTEWKALLKEIGHSILTLVNRNAANDHENLGAENLETIVETVESVTGRWDLTRALKRNAYEFACWTVETLGPPAPPAPPAPPPGPSPAEGRTTASTRLENLMQRHLGILAFGGVLTVSDQRAELAARLCTNAARADGKVAEFFTQDVCQAGARAAIKKRVDADEKMAKLFKELFDMCWVGHYEGLDDDEQMQRLSKGEGGADWQRAAWYHETTKPGGPLFNSMVLGCVCLGFIARVSSVSQLSFKVRVWDKIKYRTYHEYLKHPEGGAKKRAQQLLLKYNHAHVRLQNGANQASISQILNQAGRLAQEPHSHNPVRQGRQTGSRRAWNVGDLRKTVDELKAVTEVAMNAFGREEAEKAENMVKDLKRYEDALINFVYADHPFIPAAPDAPVYDLESDFLDPVTIAQSLRAAPRPGRQSVVDQVVCDMQRRGRWLQ